jgi:VCBS repeat protein
LPGLKTPKNQLILQLLKHTVMFVIFFLISFIMLNIQVHLFSDVSTSHLPLSDLGALSMDAAAADFDSDGDLDILIANEHKPNIFLVNNGKGKFTNMSQALIPQVDHDSEDIGIADFDHDGDLDIIVVSEDDKVNELYLNNGDGSFADAGERIPVTGTSNAVLIMDVNSDGHQDIIIGNNGQNRILINNGKAYFTDETGLRLRAINDVTQSLAAGDVNNDGYPDLILANEGKNRVLINNGKGVFTDESATRMQYRTTLEESREVDLGDIDGDGDLDIFFANVAAFVDNADRQNRLLINNGKGYFKDVTESNLPKDMDRSFTGTFFDIDSDGDLDIITGNVNGDRFGGSTPFRVYLNNSHGNFVDGTSDVFPSSITGRGFDMTFADFNNDDKTDIYFANRGTADILVFGNY